MKESATTSGVICRWIMGLCLGLALVAGARAEGDCAAEQTHVDLRNRDPLVLKEVERRWIQAYADPDVRLLTCVLAEDFEIGSMPDRKLEVNNKQHVLEWVSRKASSLNQIEQLVIGSHGDVAVARGVYSVRGQDRKLTSRFQFTDIFVYRKGQWQAISREISSLPLD